MTRTIFLYSVMSALRPAAYQATSSCLGATLRQCVWSFRPRHRWSTISLGMGLAFRQAYRSLGLRLPMGSITVHGTRAVSAFLTRVRVVFQQKFGVGFQKPPASFVHYYLRDVRAHLQDGAYGVTDMVLSQAATALLRGSAYLSLASLVDRYFCGWYTTPCIVCLSSSF